MNQSKTETNKNRNREKAEIINTLTDAIKVRKERTEMNKLRDEKVRQGKVKNDVSSILNSIIDAVPVVSKKKKIEKQQQDIKQRKRKVKQ